MTKRIFIPSMIFGLLLLSAIFTQAMSEPDLRRGCSGDESRLELGDGRRGEGQGQRLEMMATILELSDDQQEQVRQLFSAERDSHQAMRQEMRAAREALDKLSNTQPFDEAAFRSLARQQAEQRIAAQVARAKLKQQIYATLTSEQQEKADQLWTLIGKRHQGHGMRR